MQLLWIGALRTILSLAVPHEKGQYKGGSPELLEVSVLLLEKSEHCTVKGMGEGIRDNNSNFSKNPYGFSCCPARSYGQAGRGVCGAPGAGGDCMETGLRHSFRRAAAPFTSF